VNRKAILLTLASVLAASVGSAIACEYKAGETKFLDYANCRYGADSIVVVDLPENASWESCIYLVEAFRPEKLLAVTKEQDGKETHSINARGNIGNPCYLTKQSCDAAMKAHKATQQ
jgi:hypothetical protein